MSARVLVIEDNPENMELMVYLLRALGHEVMTATDGAEGLEVAKREVPDAVLCDLRMPGMDGFEAARRLKAQPALRDIPLVAISASVTEFDRARSREVGFQEFIAKPVEPEHFLERVKALLHSVPDAGSRRRNDPHSNRR